jgi:3-phenylpropionate/trans-cinnamate dioxygenase ferredoxin reductase component
MMAPAAYDYAIVGAGLAGAWAVTGIREVDPNGSILLLGSEPDPPYDRPPLSKQLWFGKKQLADIFLHDAAWYESQGVTLSLGTEVQSLEAAGKTVTDASGRSYGFGKLLLATGGRPRLLPLPGGNLEGICYYRYLSDYRKVQPRATAGARAVVIGGGFIGSEMAAALTMNQVAVTMIYPSDQLVPRVFTRELGQALEEAYRRHGVTLLRGESAAEIRPTAAGFVTVTTTGQELASELLIVGVGILPSVGLAQQAGLEVADGVVVDSYLQTSHPDIYAAGDLACFPYTALGERRRVEHWDNAVNQGKAAGRNLAGAGERYDYMPYFYSDLFEFGYEAVGDVTAGLDTFSDWQKEFDTGVVYYLKEGRLRGAMMCNVWGKVDFARQLIRGGGVLSTDDLRGAIR